MSAPPQKASFGPKPELEKSKESRRPKRSKAAATASSGSSDRPPTFPNYWGGVCSSADQLGNEEDILAVDHTDTEFDKSLVREFFGHGQHQGAENMVGSAFYFELGVNKVIDAVRSAAMCLKKQHCVSVVYYAGHGVDPTDAARYRPTQFPNIALIEHSSLPHARGEFKYVKKQVTGGEWHLFHFGLCSFRSLINLWAYFISKRKAEPESRHLIIVTDSCFSGQWVKELQEWFKENPASATKFSVTVQSSGKLDQPVPGRLFTPLFMRFQDNGYLQDAIKRFSQMTNKESTLIDELTAVLPQPQAFSTHPGLNGELQNSPLPTNSAPYLGACDRPNGTLHLLGPNAFRFYLFCLISDPKLYGNVLSTTRQLDQNQVTEFLEADKEWKVLAVKFRKYVGAPFPLFYLNDPAMKDKIVCVHFHLTAGLKTVKGGVNFFHHTKDDTTDVWEEDEWQGHSKDRIARADHGEWDWNDAADKFLPTKYSKLSPGAQNEVVRCGKLLAHCVTWLKSTADASKWDPTKIAAQWTDQPLDTIPLADGTFVRRLKTRMASCRSLNSNFKKQYLSKFGKNSADESASAMDI